MGRRKMMMMGASGQAVCYILISALLSQAGDSRSTEGAESPMRTPQQAKFGAASVAFFFLYYAFFGMLPYCLRSNCCTNKRFSLRELLARNPLALPRRDQLFGYAHKGSSIRFGFQLDLKLRRCTSDPLGNRELGLEILPRLDVPKYRHRPYGLLLLPGDGKQAFGRHRSDVQRE